MMLCYMCKVRGEAKYIKSVDSFSAAMRRGDYGKYATTPFCLMHTAGDQRNWVDGLEMQAQCGLLSSYSNDVETEQLLCDDSTRHLSRGHVMSFVQVRRHFFRAVSIPFKDR